MVLAYISADLTFSLIHHPSPISASEFSLLPSTPSCSLHEGPLHLLFFLPLHFSLGPSLHSISTKHHFCTAVYPNHLLYTCTLSSLLSQHPFCIPSHRLTQSAITLCINMFTFDFLTGQLACKLKLVF